MNECNIWRPCRDLHWLDKLQFSIWRFFLQTAQNNHQLCYWLMMHNLISKICSKFQVSCFHISEVNELLDEYRVRIVWGGKISTKLWLKNMTRQKPSMIFLAWYLCRKQWLRLVAVSQATSDWVCQWIQKCWNSLQPPCQFAWHWVSECTNTCAFIMFSIISSTSLCFFPS